MSATVGAGFFRFSRRLSLEGPLAIIEFELTAMPGEVTLLLQAWRRGDRDAETKLFGILMPDLHRIAAACFRGERPGHTMQPTALVNEAFFRLAANKGIDWNDRGHFLAFAARVMRRYLIDVARVKPDVAFIQLDNVSDRLGNHSQLELATAIDRLLDELDETAPRQRAVVEFKFFLGMSDSEAAEALELSLHTTQREWYRARKWLFSKLTASFA